MTRRSDPSRWVGPVADLVCIVTFILVGAGRHDIDEGASWFLTVLWPLAVGWFVAGLALRLYRAPDRQALRLLGTVAAGTALMIVLRGAFTDRPWVSVFTVIYAAWMLATAFGWRAVARVVTSRRRGSTSRHGARAAQASADSR